MKIKFSTYFEGIKLIISVFLIGVVIFFGFKVVDYVQNMSNFGVGSLLAVQELVDTQNRTFTKLIGDSVTVVRANTDVVSSLRKEIKTLEKERSDLVGLIKKNGEEIKNIGVTQAKLDENVRQLRVDSNHTYKEGTGDYNEQYFKKIMYVSKDDKGNDVEVPVAWSMFFPNREPEKQWKTGVYPLEYYSRVVQAEQKTGQLNTYTEVWFVNNKDKASRGIKVPINIESSEFTQLRVKDSTMHWWAPHLNLGVDTYMTGVGAGLSFSFMGYGKTKNDLDWKFIDIGVGGNSDDFYFKFAPISWNTRAVVPFLKDTFLSPFVGIKGGYTFGLSINTGL